MLEEADDAAVPRGPPRGLPREQPRVAAAGAEEALVGRVGNGADLLQDQKQGKLEEAVKLYREALEARGARLRFDASLR